MVSQALRKYVGRFQSMKHRLENIKDKAEETMGTALQTVEVNGAAFLWSYANEAYGTALTDKNGQAFGELQVMNIPIDILAGVVFHGLGFMGSFGKYHEHAHNLGDGSLAAYLARIGAQMGRAKKSHTAGALPQYTAGSWQRHVGYDWPAYQGVG